MTYQETGNGDSPDRRPQEAPDWNVLTDPWMELLDPTENLRQVSPLDALRHAQDYHCIAAGSPLDLFAAHRFLLTLLYWKAEAVGGIEALREALLTGHVPSSVTEALETEKEKFLLFDEESPFLQDSSLRKGKDKLKSMGYFFSEMATGTNIAHFSHNNQADTKLCLACATLGILRMVPWSQQGGRSFSPGVHGVPPIFAVACGNVLTETLGLNLISFEGEPGIPMWTGSFTPKNLKTIRPLEAFTWNPRRVLLGKPEETGRCSLCGQAERPVIDALVYKGNEATGQKKKGKDKIPFAWEDPAAHYDPNEHYRTKKSTRADRAADGRDLGALHDPEAPPRCALCERIPGHNRWILVVPTTDKDKAFDHRRIDLARHPAEAVPALIPEKPTWQPVQKALNGWEVPSTSPRYTGCLAFVTSAADALTPGDWGNFSMAAFRKMHEAPTAFDVFCGLWWPVRKKHYPPSRDIAWLILKLMARVPEKYRKQAPNATFEPLTRMPKRQIRGNQKHWNPYPVAFSTGDRLEADLAETIDKNLRRRNPSFIDWAGLCDRLHLITG